MKLKILTGIVSIFLLGACKKVPLPNTPGVGVILPVGFFSATIGGNISGVNILDKGVCWGTNENPGLDGNSISAGSGATSFEIQLTGLASQVRYNVRTYAVNETGTVYSNNIAFTTNAAVGLTTNAVSSVSSNSAVCSGILGSSTTFTATERGICWSTSNNPVVTNNKSVSTNAGSSTFAAALNNLNINTTYYVRAYASSGVGTVYGNEVTFKTFGELLTDIEGNKYNTVTIGSQVWMVENLRVTKYRNGQLISYKADYDWATNSQDAYGYYDNSTSNRLKFGNLYNYLAISDTRKLAPEGWHIPSLAEWQALVNYLGGTNKAGIKLMSDVLGDWPLYASTPTNESMFRALPGGLRNLAGADQYQDYGAYFWANTASGSDIYTMSLIASGSAVPNIQFSGYDKKSGCSVRCIKD